MKKTHYTLLEKPHKQVDEYNVRTTSIICLQFRLYTILSTECDQLVCIVSVINNI